MRRRILKPPFVRPILDRSHPLAQGLTDYYLLNEHANPVNLVGGEELTPTASPTWSVGRRGRQINFNGTSQYVSKTSSGLNLAAGGTLFVGYVLASASTGRNIIGSGHGTNTNPINLILTDNTDSSKVRAFFRDNAGANCQFTSVGAPAGVNVPVLAAFTWSVGSAPSNYRLILNGRFDTEGVSVAGAPAVTAHNRFAIGTLLRNTPSGFFPGGVFVGGAHSRFLSDDEAEWITADPYDLIKDDPPRTYYYLAGGGGPGSPTTLEVGRAQLAFTGKAVSVNAGRRVAPARAQLAFTGQDVNVNAGRTLAVDKAALGFTGRGVTASGNRTITPGRAQFELTGQAVGVNARTTLVVGRTQLAITGKGVVVNARTVKAIGKAALAFTGRDVSVNSRTQLEVGKAVLGWSGKAVTIAGNRVFNIGRASLEWTGRNLIVRVQRLDGPAFEPVGDVLRNPQNSAATRKPFDPPHSIKRR